VGRRIGKANHRLQEENPEKAQWRGEGGKAHAFGHGVKERRGSGKTGAAKPTPKSLDQIEGAMPIGKKI